jgi:hypothetical protein
MKRILTVLTVAVVMAAMMVASALPALAANPNAPPVDFNAPPQFAPVGPPTHSATNPETILVVHCGGFSPNTQGVVVTKDGVSRGGCQEPPREDAPLIEVPEQSPR